MPGLHASAKAIMKREPIFLNLEKADLLLAQFQETSQYRNWNLRAVSIMRNHFHLVVIVPGDPDPKRVLADFKAYGSRILNKHFGKPASETWWTDNGSKRKLPNDKALEDACRYVLYKQPYPLVVWSPELGRIV